MAQYTNELENILSYIKDTLLKEYPSKEITLQYLITSILYNKNSHANIILDSCLMSYNIEELKNIYTKYLSEHSDKLLNIDINHINYDDEFKHILNVAKIEASLNSSDNENIVCGSEHILLALLNKDNPNSIQNVLFEIGLNYEMIISKCEINHNQTQKTNKIKKINNIKPISMPQKTNITYQNNQNNIKFITQYTINISQLANEGKLPIMVGREKELNELVKTLARKSKNNAIIVGDGGVGKTSLIYGLAYLINDKNRCPLFLKNKEILSMDIISMVSGTNFRGMFEERVKGLFNELINSNKYILFIDDMDNVIKSNNREKDTDISSMINEILSGGEVQIIGTTNFKGYRNSIENNSSISRKLHRINIEEMNENETFKVLHELKNKYEEYHKVSYDDEILKLIVRLSKRYITDRKLPDSALDVMDLCGASNNFNIKEPEELTSIQNELLNIRRLKKDLCLNKLDDELNETIEKEKVLKENLKKINEEFYNNINNNIYKITEQDVLNSVSDLSRIPINKMSSDDMKLVANIENILKEVVVGQDEAVEKISKIIKRNRVGLGSKNRVAGNIFCCGPSGCGKTLLAKTIAKEIYGDENALIRIDMSEYSEKNSVSKLTGAAPSYVGYENGGQLTEAVKNKPYCVLLLDEIEKANQEVYNVFLQLFDEGRLTDSSGCLVNFKNVIVIMTSNIGAKEAQENSSSLGFINTENENKRSIYEKSLKQKFTPEFLNRIDQIVYFNSLNDENLKDILLIELKKLKQKLNDIHFDLEWNDDVINLLLPKAIKEKNYGARPIIRLIQDEIEDLITEHILKSEYPSNYCFKLKVENSTIII